MAPEALGGGLYTEGVTYGTGSVENSSTCTEGVTYGTGSMEEGSVCIKEVAHSSCPSLS